MIRSIRRAMNVTLKDQRMDDEKLVTLFAEAEAILNQRPLTPNPDSPHDLGALTPNQLMHAGKSFRAPPGVFTKQDMYQKRWRHVQLITNNFWQRWSREYLATLLVRSKWLEKSRNIQVGDLVLMSDEKTHRNFWPLARVQEVFVGRDNNVRSCMIKTAQGVYKRPVNKLCLLEGVE